MSDYKIGYRRPPRSGQIKKGEVRNPHGRAGKNGKSKTPPETSEAAILERINAEVVEVDGRATTKREAYVRSHYMNALKGKVGAIRFIDTLSQLSQASQTGGGVLRVPYDGEREWNLQRALDQLAENKRKQARRERRRKRPAVPVSGKSDVEVFLAIEEETMMRAGRPMQMREVRLRQFIALAAKGNRAAQAAIERICQAALDARTKPKAGFLVVPEPVSQERWAEMAFKSQAKFRGEDPEGLAELEARSRIGYRPSGDEPED